MKPQAFVRASCGLRVPRERFENAEKNADKRCQHDACAGGALPADNTEGWDTHVHVHVHVGEGDDPDVACVY